MRIQFIILILITNLTFGQEKVAINKNTLNYEINDEFERFDDIGNSENDYKRLHLNFKSDSLLIIENNHGAGFVGEDITFTITKNLQIKDAKYNYWTDNPNPKKMLTYKVKKVNLSLNQNPFEKTNGLRGNYSLQIEEYSKDSLNRIKVVKGKFKTFKDINKESTDYKWVLEQDKTSKNFKNSNGVYFNLEIPPTLKSNSERLSNEVKKLNGFETNDIKALIVINEKGKIEKAPIRFSISLNDKLKMKLIELLIKYTEWYPACVNGKAVKSQIPIIISTE